MRRANGHGKSTTKAATSANGRPVPDWRRGGPPHRPPARLAPVSGMCAPAHRPKIKSAHKAAPRYKKNKFQSRPKKKPSSLGSDRRRGQYFHRQRGREEIYDPAISSDTRSTTFLAGNTRCGVYSRRSIAPRRVRPAGQRKVVIDSPVPRTMNRKSVQGTRVLRNRRKPAPCCPNTNFTPS